MTEGSPFVLCVGGMKWLRWEDGREQGRCLWQVGCENGAGMQGWVMGFDEIPEKWGHRLGNFWYCFQSSLLLDQGPWGSGLENNRGSRRDVCTALMPSCLSRRTVLLSNIWFGLDPPALFSLSYHRVLSFPTRRYFFSCQNVFLFAFVGTVRMKSGIISSHPLQSSSSPGSGFQVFPEKSSRQLFFQSEQLNCYPCPAWRYQRGRGWRICRIEPHKLICRTCFKCLGHWTKR